MKELFIDYTPKAD